MLFLCICSLVSLHLHRFSVSSSGPEGSEWCVGRVNASSLQVCASIGGGDLDPAGCCKDKRHQVAALPSVCCCYCGNQLHGLLSFNTSSNEETKDVKTGSERQRQEGMVALDRIEGLFQCSLRASGSPGREQGGRTCARKVSGNLGVCFQECTENEGLKEDFLRVTVMTSRGQSSPQLNVSHDDLFTACSDWIWNTSEKHKNDVHASGLHLELSLEVSCRVSCTRFGPDRELVEEVCSARDGLVKDYSCCFAPQDKDGTETTRLHSSDRLKGSLVRVSSEERLLVLEFMLESQNNHSKEVHEDPSGPVMLCDHVIRIHTENQAYSTNTDITLLAVVDILDPVDFLWDFGDFTSARVNSRTVTKRYRSPGIYKLVVVAFWGQVSVRSKEFSLLVQRAVKLNRLVHAASVMQNHTVTVSCRVNVGTNLTFLWSFGDGTVRFGLSTEQHVFVRTGEFNIVVIASNLVSSASLSSYLFVVDRPCKPPPVKSLGPPKIQVRRHEVVRLGVSFDSDLNCSVSGELHYSWTLHDSAGLTVPLPVTSTHRQSLVLQSFTLQYGIYKATARVQIVGSVVYSNYTVRLQVVPSPVVVVILGGTNIYVNIKSSGEVTLDGRASYDPDFPSNSLRYSWTCQPVSTISSFCFNQSIPTSSPVLKFPMSLLKSNFDQFQFTLTVHSEEHSASSEIFLTLSSHPTGKVSVYCPKCQGDQVSWDQAFSVRAMCEDCNDSAEIIHFSWRLFLVNASSKPVTEIPFCYTVDLNAPSAVVENAFTSTSAPEKSLFTEDSSTSSRTPRVYQNSELTSPALSLTHGFSESITGIDHLFSNLPDQQNMFNEFQNDPESSGEWEFTFPSLESEDPISQRGDSSVPHVEEGDPGISSGRPKDPDIESFPPESDSSSHSLLHKDEGSNLVDPKPSLRTQKPGLLDLHRDLVDKSLFESYTHTGISSSLLSFRSFSLKPSSTYMLEVTAKSQRRFYGQTQLFLKTKPVPKDVACQVQPVRGKELLTHFSIFCTSGKEDLIYKYSFSVGGGTPRILYQGRDFQCYFSLPSGDPRDEHKVIIYTEIRSSMYGSVTKLCPVTVRVEPSFLRNSSSSSSHHDPDLMISESGLRNVSVLVQLGNVAEIYNYISLLCSVLNRLSLDSPANTHALRHLRNVLICIVCKLGYSEQASAADSIFILNDLLHVQSQVTLQSARWVTAHVSAVSMQFSESNQNILRALVSLLSSSLQVVTSSPLTSSSADSLESHPAMGKSRNAFVDDPYHCITDLSKVIYGKESESIPKKQMMRVVNDLLQTSSDLMLRNFVLQKTTELRVSSDLITLCAGFLNKTSTSIRCGSITFYLPASLIEMLLLRDSISAKRGFPQKEGPPCVHIIGMEFVHDPFRWGKYPVELDGPVADLSLYKCDSRRKIPVYSFIQPITVELDFPQKRGSTSEYTLLRSHINYHNFSITQEHLQQAVQVTVVFTTPSHKAFPVKLLFRMFERPTPSVHHLLRILNWGNNTILLTLPASYLSVAGVGHLALLDANFGKTPTRRHLTEQISYSLTVESSLCLSWDDQQGSWTQNGCRTLRNDRNSAVNCSCHQLKPIKVLKQQIQSSYFRDDLDQFLSAPRHLTVPFVLLFCVSLYIPVLVWCKKTDATSEENRRAHFLPDNSATDQHLYAVTVHTGLCSAARMSARVYIVLHGEDGRSQTKELHVPGCTLFTRNSQNTFILSAADSLGSVWGVHIWHNNSGPSPEWYLEQVQVSELMPGHVEGRSWHFISQCWLAVHKGDGQVERMLRASTHGLTFFKMLLLKLFEYLPDYHIWMSVYTCPCPHPFTRGQRLSVCLLLFLGYTCVNAVITSQLDDQLAFDLGVIDVTSVAIATGLVSAVAVLPVAMVISFLFRLQSGRLTEDIYYKNAFSKREPRGTKYQDTDLLLVSTRNLESKDPGDEEPIQPEKNKRNKDSAAFESIQELLFQEVLQVSRRSLFLKKSKTNDECELPPQNEAQHDQVKRRCGLAFLLCRCVAWTLCLLLSVSCLIISGVLGTRFSSGMVLLWIHSLFVSLTFCIFVIHPAMVLCLAVIASWRFKKSRDFYCYFSKMNYHLEALKHQDADQLQSSDFTFTRVSNVEKVLEARQRARYLRHVRPPTRAELRKTRAKKKREALIHKMLRDLCLCGSMFVLMVCITYGSPVDEHYKLNAAMRRLFVGCHGSDFMSIKKHEEWWKWMQTSLLSILYHNESEITQMSYVLIGDPLVQKTEVCRSFSQVSMVTPPRPCYHIGSSSEQLVTVDLGFTRSEATSNLRLWHLSSWLSEQTVALKVQFTFYSPSPNLFSSVTLLSEKSSTGLFQSSTVQSVRVYHSPSKLDYTVMLCQLLFLLLSLVNLYYQVFTAAQQGLMGSWKTTSFSVEVSLMIVSLLYYVHYVYRPVLVTELAKQLRINPRGHVDVSALANLEQFSRTLRGIILFLLAVKCVTVLRVNRTLPPSVPLLSLSSLLLPVISGLPLLWMFSCTGRLLYIERSFHSIQTVLWHFWSLQKPKGLICLWKDFYYFGFLFASSTMLTAMVFAVMIRKAKRSHKTKNLTIREVLGYVSQKFTGMNRQIADCHKQKIYFLEECESLVDELLFKLSALSNSLHHTLPPKLPTYTDENSPVASSTTELYKEKTQDFASSLTVGQGETTPTSSHVRPQFELQEVQHYGGSGGCKEAPKRFWREDNYESTDEHRTEKATRGGLGATHSHVVVVEALVHHEEGNLITKTSV